MQTNVCPAGPSRPRPPAPPCLDCERASTSKGGTLIADDVTTLEEHQRRVADPDAYRPDGCPTCGARMHAHDLRERKPIGDPELPPSIAIRRFACSVKECRAVWRVLPGFLARCLWRAWPTVTASLLTDRTRHVVVPSRTRRRWAERLRSCGRKLARVIGVASERLGEIVARLDPMPSRGEVVDALGGLGQLAAVTALVHRVGAGVRVM
jgi:hypothetical protein